MTNELNDAWRGPIRDRSKSASPPLSNRKAMEAAVRQLAKAMHRIEGIVRVSPHDEDGDWEDWILLDGDVLYLHHTGNHLRVEADVRRSSSGPSSRQPAD